MQRLHNSLPKHTLSQLLRKSVGLSKNPPWLRVDRARLVQPAVPTL